MGYSRLETGYNSAVSGVVRLPDNTVLNLTSLSWTDQIDAVIGVADEYIGYDFGNELRDFVAELSTNPFEGAYETDETDDVVEDAEYLRSDDFLMQLNPLIKYDDAFEEMQTIVDNFTRAISRKQKVTVKAFKELLANIQNELNELPKN